MIVKIKDIAYGRSGDKGANSNVGLIFINKDVYDWGKNHITEAFLKKIFSNIVLGKITRYELDNINSFNFILNNSLVGGGSESLKNSIPFIGFYQPAEDGNPKVYVCQNFSCKLPTSDFEAVKEQLGVN